MKLPFTTLFLCLPLIFSAQDMNIHGKFIDPRDSTEYRTVVIGEQIWMADNLNFKIDGSYCYLNTVGYCESYGRLYVFESAVKACPAGWHLPSDEEWKKLEIHAGMKKKTANKTDYRGTRPGQGSKLRKGGSTGLEIIFGGAYSYVLVFHENQYEPDFVYIGKRGYYWTSSKYEPYQNRSWARFFKNIESINRNPFFKDCAFSVRCIKDN